MNCAEIQHYLDPLLDNELSVEESARILHHLDACGTCQEQWDKLSKLRAKLHDTFNGISVPDNLVSNLRKAVARNTDSSSKLVVFPLALISVAAAVVALFVFSPGEEVKNTIVASDIVQEESKYSPDTKPVASSGTSSSAQNPMKLVGWTMVDCKDCQIGKKPALRFSFAKEDDPAQTLSFYRLQSGQFKPNGMDEHDFDGTKICCSELGKTAMIFCHGVGHDNVLVSNIPLNDLMSLAMKNRISST